jgi:hypothetical protein
MGSPASTPQRGWGLPLGVALVSWVSTQRLGGVKDAPGAELKAGLEVQLHRATVGMDCALQSHGLDGHLQARRQGQA